MRLWIDDVRPAPEDMYHEWVWVKTVHVAKEVIEVHEEDNHRFELISIDHDAGDYARAGGDYIKLLDWLEETGRNYPIHIHSMNVVGRMNMEAIIERNGWKEIK